MALQDEKKTRYRLFKAPRSTTWKAELNFPDGSSEVVTTDYGEKQRAAMSAGHIWAKKARAKGLATGRASEPAALIAAAREGGPAATNGTQDASSRVAGLMNILTAIENLDPV